MTSNDVLFLCGIGIGLFLVFVGVTVWSWVELKRVSKTLDALSDDHRSEINELWRRLSNLENTVDSITSGGKEGN